MNELRIERDGMVAVLTVDRPPYNHVSVDLIRAIADAAEDVDRDPDLRAIVLRTAGKVFCAGADFTPSVRGEIDAGGDFTRALYAQAIRLFGCGTPIVAAVQGAAVGAGLGLALAADFRVAAPEARFAANFVKLGFHPGFGITHTLPRVIGMQRASWMLLSGARVGGEQAFDWGLADQLAPLDRLDDAALAVAREIAANAPLAVAATRATLRRDLIDALKAATGIEATRQAELNVTEDFREGVAAVAERRPGNFVGR